MAPQDRAYTYEVAAELTVTGAASLAGAQATATTALDTLRTSLATLAENVELSFPETPGGPALSAVGQSGSYAVNGVLIVGTDESESAQSVAGDAATSIAANPTSGVTITLDQENGQYVLQQIG